MRRPHARAGVTHPEIRATCLDDWKIKSTPIRILWGLFIRIQQMLPNEPLPHCTRGRPYPGPCPHRRPRDTEALGLPR